MGASVSQKLGAKVDSPYILAQSAVPVCLAPNGTVATNGIVTLGTALPMTYSTGIWLRLPANAIVGGLAGLYWAVMTSTTQGQVYTNFADPATEFIPFIPSGTLVAAVGSNAAYTQTTGADVTLINTQLPGGSMGLSGALRVGYLASTINNANTKGMGYLFGGQNLLRRNETTIVGSQQHTLVRNRGSMNRQVCMPGSNGTFSGTGSAAATAFNIDTSATVSVVIVSQLAVATDFVVIEGFTEEVMPS